MIILFNRLIKFRYASCLYCGDRVQTVTIFGLLHFLGDFKMPLFSDGCDYLSENVFSQIEGILN